MDDIPMVFPTRFLLNPDAARADRYPPALRPILSHEAHGEARGEITSWPGYQPTPLVPLPGLARRLGTAEILYKDESGRFGQGSFKALGGGYGVLVVLRRHLRETTGRESVSSRSLMDGEHAEATAALTVTCASAGNHGMSVARGASLFRCRAVIFLPARTSASRKAAIQGAGAEVVEVAGSYDDAVAEADRVARERGWHVVSDTAYPGYEEIPRFIMQGYTVMVGEVLEQVNPSPPPTHVFVQGGVGGLAAAVCAHFWEALGGDRPRTVVVEPAAADCLLESALRRGLAPSAGDLATSMTCLACRTPSTLAWPVLRGGADAFLSIPDPAAEDTLRLLATGPQGDPPLGTQPSGAAGLAGLLAAIHEPALADPLRLGPGSRVLVIGSEGPGPDEEDP